MAYRLTYARDAEKGLAGMPKVDARRVLAKLEQLAEDPQAMPGVKKLTDHEGYHPRERLARDLSVGPRRPGGDSGRCVQPS